MNKIQGQAIFQTHPNIVRIDDELGCFDIDGNSVTFDQAVVDAKAAELQAAEDAVAYKQQRQPEYPSLADLADALYWSSKGDNTKIEEYYAACEAVKAKYPKPEVS